MRMVHLAGGRGFRRGAAAAIVFGLAVPAAAAPTCTTEADPARAACGGRVVAEPEASASYLQHGIEYEPVLRAVERLAPGFVQVFDAAALAPDAGAGRSAGNRPLWVVRVTDESVTTPKLQVAVTLSSHGDEPAGREGGLRFLEDLAHWAVDDPAHLLRAGDASVQIGAWLRAHELWLSVPNPDGWASGDHTTPFPRFLRGNGNFADLNREFPTLGWRTAPAMREPEAKLWGAVLASLPRLAVHLDVHGETESPTGSFLDVMWPAGQWDPVARRRERDFAERMIRSAERHMAQAVPSEELQGHLPRPASVANAYDIVGYDDAGFLGDWMAQRGVLALDVEVWPNLKPDGPPASATAYNQLVERLRVAAVRGAMEATLVAATVPAPSAPALGRLAVIDDGVRVGGADRLRWFDELAVATATPVTRLSPAAVDDTALAAVDTVVLADVAPADAAAAVAVLRRFAEAGGQVLLTDRALGLLPGLGVAAEVRETVHVAGHVDFGPRDHPWERNLPEHARQTYTQVPLGYRGRGVAEAPHTGVTPATWPGSVAATVAGPAGDLVAVGDVAVGDGRIAVFGAVLPRQRAHADWLGLADHGVTIAGGDVLEAILSYRRP